MSLEATMLVLDNSSYSINGDFTPTRLQAQADAVHLIFNRKLNANPENEVGLMVMAGKAPEVLVTPTRDEGKLIAALHTIKSSGQADLNTGIQVAQLALKHRQNKNQRQRIIVFVGSPIGTPSAALIKLGKKMKKNNVAIDIVSFSSPSDLDSIIDLTIPSTSNGPTTSSTTTTTQVEPETNATKLTALYESVNSSDNSHLVRVEPSSQHLLSERIAQSPILRTEGGANDDDDVFGAGAGRGGSGGAGGGDEYGVDPNLDPELAMALRMSLEEERARQAMATSSSTSAATSSKLESVQEDVKPKVVVEAKEETNEKEQHEAESSTTDVGMEHDEGEDDDLAKALAMSRGAEAGNGGEDVEMDEDEEIARAIAMSMQDAQENEQKDASGEGK